MLVPIKPVTCECKSAKFKDWCIDKGAYEVTPIEGNQYTVKVELTDLNITVKVDEQIVNNGDTINDVNSNFITLTCINSTANTSPFRLYAIFGDGTSVPMYSINLLAHETVVVSLPVTQSMKVVRYIVTAGTYTLHYNDNRERGDFKLSDVVESDLITDTEDEFLNTYYANWCIVDPFDDFESELKVAFMLAEDKLRAYKAQLTDFNPGAHTVMTVDYGERGNTDYGYRYPIGGTVESSAPNTGAKSTVNEVTDTTTVDKNEEPFKNLDKTKAMDGWLRFFVDQFKDCFTLCEAMTW